MKDYVIKCNSICKNYRNNKILDNLSLSIKEGDIYGFVGKNGAGKTTTIRIILGLLKPNSGSIELFENKEEINSLRKNIGSLIEKPLFYGNMTARENLQLVKIQRCLEDSINIDEILQLVKLQDSSKKCKNFSLGMKQRLGIALALLNNPKLLILDEPINGLDPVGIKEIRELLLDLNKKYNTTILISSHILSELEQMATRYGFINNGTVIKEISASDLHSEVKHSLHLKVNKINKIDDIFKLKLNITNYKINADSSISIYDNVNLENFSIALAQNGISIFELFNNEENLETYFNRLIKEEI